MTSYMLDKKLRNRVHPKYGQRLGFKPMVVSAKSLDHPEHLIDALLASACTPPFTPLYNHRGQPVLDGGVVDNVPLITLDKSEQNNTLVLTTRKYQNVPEINGITYLQPSSEIPIVKWDYTSPEKLQAAFDLGVRDGETFLQRRSEHNF